MTRSRRLLVVAVMTLTAVLTPLVAAAQDVPAVGFGSVAPDAGPPGTEIAYTVVGSPNADAECRGSSAFATEFLAADGTRLATGFDTVAVPDTATAGPGFLRLICYIADGTGRRVIHGFCAAFEVTAPGSAAPGAPAAALPINDPCPPSARVAASQSVIAAATALGSSFNQVITPIGG